MDRKDFNNNSALKNITANVDREKQLYEKELS